MIFHINSDSFHIQHSSFDNFNERAVCSLRFTNSIFIRDVDSI